MNELWQRFCVAAERPELATDARFATVPARQERFAEVEEIVASVFASRPLTDWEERLEQAGVPNGRILSIGDALESDYSTERGFVRDLHQPGAGDLRVIGPVIRFAGEPDGELTPAPRLGQDTRGVLNELLSLDDASIDALIESGVAAGSL
jgi:crotonobetainyl-CoA:carnitine CoA-transferase CaiB-like acyl-CoA transferase